MKITKIKETKFSCTYKLESLICNAEITISKMKYQKAHLYMERCLKISPTFHSLEELGNEFMERENFFEKDGVYNGIDMIARIGCNMNVGN